VFDDLIDAVAGNVATAPGRWRPAWSGRVALLAAVALFAGGAVAAATLATRPFGPLVAGAAAGLLLVAGVVLARRNTAVLGAALAGAGMPALLAAILVGPGGTGPGWAGSPLAPMPVEAACGAVAVYALLAAILLPAHRAWFAVAFG